MFIKLHGFATLPDKKPEYTKEYVHILDNGADVNGATDQGRTPLLYAASKGGHLYKSSQRFIG